MTTNKDRSRDRTPLGADETPKARRKDSIRCNVLGRSQFGAGFTRLAPVEWRVTTKWQAVSSAISQMYQYNRGVLPDFGSS